MAGSLKYVPVPWFLGNKLINLRMSHIHCPGCCLIHVTRYSWMITLWNNYKMECIVNQSRYMSTRSTSVIIGHWWNQPILSFSIISINMCPRCCRGPPACGHNYDRSCNHVFHIKWDSLLFMMKPAGYWILRIHLCLGFWMDAYIK